MIRKFTKLRTVIYGRDSEIAYLLPQISELYHVSFICDSEHPFKTGRSDYGISYISLKKLMHKKNLIVIIACDNQDAAKAREVLNPTHLKLLHHYDALHGKSIVPTTFFRQNTCFHYCDSFNNTIDIKGNRIPDHFIVEFDGNNNHIFIDENVYFGDSFTRVTIFRMIGANNYVSIGAGTTIGEATFNLLGGGIVKIGKDCLFSRGINILPVDGHHIFDLKTGLRINWPGKITVGDHVWIGQDVTLLGNATIGDGSIVAFKAVTSSSFGKNTLIAGTPARIIRSNVCWSRDTTGYDSYTHLSQCKDVYTIVQHLLSLHEPSGSDTPVAK